MNSFLVCLAVLAAPAAVLGNAMTFCQNAEAKAVDNDGNCYYRPIANVS